MDEMLRKAKYYVFSWKKNLKAFIQILPRVMDKLQYSNAATISKKILHDFKHCEEKL